MAKIDIETVESILLQRKVDSDKVVTIIKDLEQAVQEEKEDRQALAAPKTKWENIIILYDPTNVLPDEISGWVVQQPTGENPDLIIGKLQDAAKAQNDSAKRKKSLISDIIGLFESLKSKFTKEKQLRIKTKDLTRVITVKTKTL